ncbi:MAG: hypothetical protein RIS99_1092, partial [Bacteroidota bacterium]
MQQIIENAWENRALVQEIETKQAIEWVIEELDKGRLRTAEKIDGNWRAHD